MTRSTALLRISSLLALLLAVPAWGADRTVTIGDGGSSCSPCDYSSLDGALDGEVASDADLTDEGDGYFVCYEMVDTAPVTVSGWTTGLAARVILQGAASDRTDANDHLYSAERWRLECDATAGSVVCIDIQNSHVQVQNLQVVNDVGDGYVGTGIKMGDNSTIWNIQAFGNIIYHIDNTSSSGGGTGIWLSIDRNPSYGYIYNNIIYDTSFRGTNGQNIYIDGDYNGGDFRIWNNTLVNPGNANINENDSTGGSGGSIYNNIFQDNGASGSLFQQGANDSTIGYNICGDALCDQGNGGQDNVTMVFENKAGKNFKLDSTEDTEAIDAGIDVSALLTTDIEGETRDATDDVGADEYIAAAEGGDRRIILITWDTGWDKGKQTWDNTGAAP